MVRQCIICKKKDYLNPEVAFRRLPEKTCVCKEMKWPRGCLQTHINSLRLGSLMTTLPNAKWGQERPHLTNGPLFGKYVFSNWHLHWGINDMEGSEHTVDGGRQPAEMHVVTFKSSYLTQEAALKEQDGCATIVYFFKLQEANNPAFQPIVDALYDIQKAGTGKKIDPQALTDLISTFESDYYLYWGTIDALRYIFDDNGEQLTRNFREVQPTQNRSVLHVNPSPSKFSTLLAPKSSIIQIYRCEVIYNKYLRFGSSGKNDGIILKCTFDEEELEKRRRRLKRQSKWELDMLKYVFNW